MPINKTNIPKYRHDRLYEIFANNLARIRQKAGLKMYAAAEALGVSKSTWSQWESGKRFPNGTMLAAIAEYLEVRPFEFFQEIDVDESNTFHGNI